MPFFRLEGLTLFAATWLYYAPLLFEILILLYIPFVINQAQNNLRITYPVKKIENPW